MSFRLTRAEGASCALALPAFTLLALVPPSARADAPLEQITVSSNRVASPLDGVPAVTAGVTAQQIQDSVNAMTTAETLKYLPSIDVRERYVGDRNGIVATRTTGTVSSAETLVYADGLLLSNLLGNSYNDPPRWGIVPENEIERVDVMYGPFSALYPGNSMGGVVTLTTRMPDRLEAHVDLKGGLEDFGLYGTDERNSQFDGSAAIGDRIGNFSFWVDFDHLDAYGHPLSFATANLSTKAPATGAVPVGGAFRDLDQNGVPRLVFGGYSIDHTLQDTGTLKLAYDFAPGTRLTYTLSLWGDDSRTDAQSYLTDLATGQPFYNGAVAIGGAGYTVSGLDPGFTDELHMMNALSFTGRSSDNFDWKLAGSLYSFLAERSITAANYGQTTAGTDQRQDDTGWMTADAQGNWRPDADLLGRHEVAFGYHIDIYRLRQTTYNMANWDGGSDGSVAASSYGDTETQAVYTQDAWHLAPAWTLYLGLRDEFWDASDGSNTLFGAKTQAVFYPGEHQSDLSPKAALAWQLTPAIEERFSFGRAVRYPTVGELYQQVTSGNEIVRNDPDLKPEDVLSYDWTSEYMADGRDFRLSLFQEDRHNALFSQTDTSVSPNITQIENITAARFRGVEAAFSLTDLALDGLDLSGSLTYTDTEILSDTQAPAADGKQYPRIPHWRARLVATYRQDEALTYSVGLRYSSASFSTLLNTDVNHDVYGGISSYLVADARINYRLGNGLTAALGVDNIGDEKYYVSPHPYPQITGFTELRYDY